MQVENRFTVPVPPEEAWGVLLDVERVAPCMPGATLEEVRGDELTGNVKLRVGPVMMTYRGDAKFVTKDPAARRAVLEASGRDQRGGGTARSVVEMTLHPAGVGATEVLVVTDLALTGKPAQLGRSAITQVAGQLIGEFAERLADELQRTQAMPSMTSSAEDAGEPETATVPGPAMAAATRRDNAIDVLRLGQGRWYRRLAVAVGGALALVLAGVRGRAR